MINKDAYILICCDEQGESTVIYPKKFKENGKPVPMDFTKNGYVVYNPTYYEFEYLTDFIEVKEWARSELNSKYKRIVFAKVKDIITVDFKSEYENPNALS